MEKKPPSLWDSLLDGLAAKSNLEKNVNHILALAEEFTHTVDKKLQDAFGERPEDKFDGAAEEEKMYRDLLAKRIRDAAGVLRGAASDLEKDARTIATLDTAEGIDVRSYSSVVATVQQTVMTAAAATRLGRLTENAMVADHARYLRIESDQK